MLALYTELMRDAIQFPHYIPAMSMQHHGCRQAGNEREMILQVYTKTTLAVLRVSPSRDGITIIVCCHAFLC